MNYINYKTYLTKRGYTLKKNLFSDKILNEIRNELTVKPFTTSEFNNIEQFKVYRENNNKMYLPKHYGINKLGLPEYIKIPISENINVTFKGSLRPLQLLCVASYLDNINKNNGGGIIVLQCGQGKTVTAIKLLSELKKKVLIIVHKEFLMNQWIERINEFLENPRIGKIQQKTFDIENKDIVICMLQSLALKDFSLDSFDSFGTVIIDEAHRIPSKVFSKALNKINAEYMIGLTATPNRKDGLTKVLKWYIGDIIFSAKNKNLDEVLVDRYILDLHRIDNDYNKEYTIGFNNSPKMPTMINNISTFYKRNNFIIKLINDLSKTDRQILILSDRRDQLDFIYNKINDNEICSVGYYVGGMNQKKLKESENKQLILGTYPMANEGLDIPTLNTLILATPKSDIVQSIGRIMRKKHEIYQPLIIDIIDNFSLFENQASKRLKLYIKNKYNIHNIEYDLDNYIIENEYYIDLNEIKNINNKEKELNNNLSNINLFSTK